MKQYEILGSPPPISIFKLIFRKQHVMLDDSIIDTYKYKGMFDIEESFDWDKSIIRHRYNLKCVICHSGFETESGHITCFIKRDSEWFYHDDDKCQKVDFDEVRKSSSGYNKTSYSLVYIQEDFDFSI